MPFGFAGGFHDRDTGMVRFGYRDYDPDAGRWTAKDPIFFAGGDTDLYRYCLNNPISFVDPDGLILSGPTGIVGGAIVGGISGAVTGAISGAEHGGLKGAIGGAITGAFTGALGGAVTGVLGGGTFGAITGSLAGSVIGEMLSPTPISQEPLPSPCS